MIDVATIKSAAAGRWSEIHANVGGLQSDFLYFDQREGPCPKCGGNTRYRGLDESTGALLCSHCFNKKNGDGIAALQWLRGWDFKTAITKLADYLGVNGNGKAEASNGKPKAAKKKTLAENAKKIEMISEASRDAVLQCYCTAKPHKIGRASCRERV